MVTERRVLTRRQMEACAGYAQGLTTSEIAERMGTTPQVVTNYRRAARQAMGARTTEELMFMLGSEVRGRMEVR